MSETLLADLLENKEERKNKCIDLLTENIQRKEKNKKRFIEGNIR